MKGKKWRDVRNSLVMVIVMVAMMSSATFAWFTMTSSPTVTGLQMQATSTGSLKVSLNNADGSYKNAVDIGTANMNGTSNPLKLTPVSLNTATNNSGVKVYGFSEPQYTGPRVTSLKDVLLTDEKLVGKVAKYTYYLKSDEDVSVGITTAARPDSGELGVESDESKLAGTFFRSKPGGSNTNGDASCALRVGLVVGEDNSIENMIIYEPNFGTASASSTLNQAPSDVTYNSGSEEAFNVKVQSDISGIITETIGRGADNYTSKKLFELTGGTAKKITMYVWLEGTDNDCVDEIKLDDIEGQIQFTVVEDAAP